MSHVPGYPRPETLTEVDLVWIEKRLQHWIRFGRPVRDDIRDRRRRTVAFRPGSVFAFVQWAANDYGTIRSRIDILRAIHPGEPCQTVPHVQPGGDLLLSVNGWPKVQSVLETIDAIEALDIDACDVAPEHWRHLNHSMRANIAPRAYTRLRHAAWLKRREIER